MLLLFLFYLSFLRKYFLFGNFYHLVLFKHFIFISILILFDYLFKGFVKKISIFIFFYIIR